VRLLTPIHTSVNLLYVCMYVCMNQPHPPRCQDNESSTIYLGWIALFVVGVFLIYIACAGIHAARRVRTHALRVDVIMGH
jgi:hypothetical protein